MFSTDLSTFLVFAALFLVIIALVLYLNARKLHQNVSAAVRYLHTQNKNAVSLRKMAEVEAALTELSDSYETLLRSVKKLGARARSRAARENGRDEPELTGAAPAGEAERAAYKTKLRDKLRKEGRL